MSMVELGQEGTTTNDERARSKPPPPARDEFAEKVWKAWKASSDALSKERRDYWTHLSFYLGEQWVWWDETRNMLQSLPQRWSPLGPGRARLTINRIAYNMGNLFGRLLKSELSFEVPATDGADDVVQGARMGEKVLEAYHDAQDWEHVRFDELFSAFMGGTSAIAVEWDGRAGIALEHDEQTGAVTVGTGDVSVNSYNITEFGIEPHVRRFGDARWWCSGLVVPCPYAKDQYELEWMPEADGSQQYSPLQHKLLQSQGKPTGNDLCLVLTYYERPNRSAPKGEYGVVINHRTVHREPWPFPFEKLNVRPFVQRRVSGRWYGTTLLVDALPVQFAYNSARSILHEHLKTAGIARLIAPRGAFDEDDFTDDPNHVLWWQPDLSTAKPEYLAPPQMASWIREEALTLRGELDDIMQVHETSRGEGFDRASGSALAILAEKDDSPLGVMARDQGKGWGDVGSMVLELIAEKATETRTMGVRVAKGIAEPVKFNGKLLRGQTKAKVPLDAVMPKSQAGQAAFAKDLWDRHIIVDPRQYARMVGLQPDEFEELLDADAARANRENLRMAMEKVELPEDFDNHAIHIAEHNRWRKSDAYRYASEDVRSLFDDHIAYHEKKAEAERLEQQQLAMVNEGLAETPKGNEAVGSEVPPPAAEQAAAAAAEANGGSAPPNLSPGGNVTPGMDQMGAEA